MKNGVERDGDGMVRNLKNFVGLISPDELEIINPKTLTKDSRMTFKYGLFILIIALRCLVFSQGGGDYKSTSMCASLTDQEQKNECNESVNSGKIYQLAPKQPIPQLDQNPLFLDQKPLFRGGAFNAVPVSSPQNIIDTVVSYSIHGDDTTKIISTERRVNVAEDEANLRTIKSAIVFMAVMTGMSVAAAVVSIIVVGNK